VHRRPHARDEIEDAVDLARERRAGEGREAGGRVLEPAARELELGAERLGAALDEEIAGVDPAAQGDDVDVELEREQAEERLAGRFRAGFVAVEHERRPARARPADQGRVVLGRRGPEDGDDVLDSLLVGRHHVGVALDEHDAPFAADLRQRAVERVDQAALLEERRLRRVDVLRSARVVVGEPARAEAGDAAALVADRDDETSAEEIVGAPLVGRPHETDRGCDAEVDSGRAHRGHERRSARGRVADTEALAGRCDETALGEVRRGARAFARRDLAPEERRGALEHRA
jgi:hypothetical protein